MNENYNDIQVVSLAPCWDWIAVFEDPNNKDEAFVYPVMFWAAAIDKSNGKSLYYGVIEFDSEMLPAPACNGFVRYEHFHPEEIEIEVEADDSPDDGSEDDEEPTLN